MGVLPFTIGHCLNAFELPREFIQKVRSRRRHRARLVHLNSRRYAMLAICVNALRASLPRRPRLRSDARMFAALAAKFAAVAVFLRLLMLAQ